MAIGGVLGSRLSISTTAIGVAVDNESAFGSLEWREIGLIESVGNFGKVFDRVVFQAVQAGRTYKFKGGFDDGSLSLVFAQDLIEGGTASGLLLPAYFYPGPLWTQATSGTPDATDYLIMNPDSGPGMSSDPAYVAAVAAAQAAGYKVLGYVATGYGVVDSAVVEAQCDTYLSWYGVNGIFFDEVLAETAWESYYYTVVSYVKFHSAFPTNAPVALNPGTIPTDEYFMILADVIVIFEGSYADYVAWTPPVWGPPAYNGFADEAARDFQYNRRTAHLVYDTAGSANMANAYALSIERHAHFIYITDDVLTNPWDTLPGYWTDEVTLRRLGINGQAVLKAAAEAPNQDNYGFRLVTNDAKIFYLRGLCMSFQTTMGSANSVLKTTATIEVNGPIVYVE